jgi:transcriptional regulator with XRE-family HTH domain
MSSENILNNFGQHLKKIRTTKNLSQEKLAQIADLDRTYISGVERGVRNISLINIVRLAEALEVPPSELFKFGEY